MSEAGITPQSDIRLNSFYVTNGTGNPDQIDAGDQIDLSGTVDNQQITVTNATVITVKNNGGNSKDIYILSGDGNTYKITLNNSRLKRITGLSNTSELDQANQQISYNNITDGESFGPNGRYQRCGQYIVDWSAYNSQGAGSDPAHPYGQITIYDNNMRSKTFYITAKDQNGITLEDGQVLSMTRNGRIETNSDNKQIIRNTFSDDSNSTGSFLITSDRLSLAVGTEIDSITHSSIKGGIIISVTPASGSGPKTLVVKKGDKYYRVTVNNVPSRIARNTPIRFSDITEITIPVQVTGNPPTIIPRTIPRIDERVTITQNNRTVHGKVRRVTDLGAEGKLIEVNAGNKTYRYILKDGNITNFSGDMPTDTQFQRNDASNSWIDNAVNIGNGYIQQTIPSTSGNDNQSQVFLYQVGQDRLARPITTMSTGTKLTVNRDGRQIELTCIGTVTNDRAKNGIYFRGSDGNFYKLDSDGRLRNVFIGMLPASLRNGQYAGTGQMTIRFGDETRQVTALNVSDNHYRYFMDNNNSGTYYKINKTTGEIQTIGLAALPEHTTGIVYREKTYTIVRQQRDPKVTFLQNNDGKIYSVDSDGSMVEISVNQLPAGTQIKMGEKTVTVIGSGTNFVQEDAGQIINYETGAEVPVDNFPSGMTIRIKTGRTTTTSASFVGKDDQNLYFRSGTQYYKIAKTSFPTGIATVCAFANLPPAAQNTAYTQGEVIIFSVIGQRNPINGTVVGNENGKVYVRDNNNPLRFYKVTVANNGALSGEIIAYNSLPVTFKTIDPVRALANAQIRDTVNFRVLGGAVSGRVVCIQGNNVYVKYGNNYYKINKGSGEVTNIYSETNLPAEVRTSMIATAAGAVTADNADDVADLYNDWNSVAGTATVTNISENMDDDAVDEARAKVDNIRNKLNILLNKLKDLGLVRYDAARGRWIATRAFTTWLNNNQNDPNYRTMEAIYRMLPHDGTNGGVFGGDSGVTINGSLEIYNNQYNDLTRNIVRSTTTVNVAGTSYDITVKDNGKTIVFGGSGYQLVYQNGRGFVFKKNGREVANANVPEELKNWKDANVREYTYNGMKYFAVRKDADNVAIISGNRTYILNKDGTIKLGNTVIPLTGENALPTEVRNWILRQGDLHLVSNATSDNDDDDIGQVDLDGTVTQGSASEQLNRNTTHKTRVETVLTNINDLIAHLEPSDELVEGTPGYIAAQSAIAIITGKECTPEEFRRYRARFNNTAAMLRDIKSKLDNINAKLKNREEYLNVLKSIPVEIRNGNDADGINLSIDQVNTLYSQGKISAAQRDQLLSILGQTAINLERYLTEEVGHIDGNNSELVIKYYQALVRIKGRDSALVRRVEGLLTDPALTKEFFNNDGTMKALDYVNNSLASRGYSQTEISIAYFRLMQMRPTTSASDNTIVERNRNLFGYCQITAADTSESNRAKARRAERVARLIQTRGMRFTRAQLDALNNYITNGGEFSFAVGRNGKWTLTVKPIHSNVAVDLGFAWHPDVARTLCGISSGEGPSVINAGQVDNALTYIENDRRARNILGINATTDYGTAITQLLVEDTPGVLERAIDNNRISDENGQVIEVSWWFTRQLYTRDTDTLHLPDFVNTNQPRYDIKFSNIGGRRGARYNNEARYNELINQYRQIASGALPGYSDEVRQQAKYLLTLLAKKLRIVGEGSNTADPMDRNNQR